MNDRTLSSHGRRTAYAIAIILIVVGIAGVLGLLR